MSAPENDSPNLGAPPAGLPGPISPETFKPITTTELDSMTYDQKVGLLAGIHVNFVNQKDLAESLRLVRLQGCLQAERDGRSLSEVVCILARKSKDEEFFHTHKRLNEKQRERMLAKMTPEEVEAYEGLGTAKRLYFEEKWATENWTWKRRVEQFPAEAEWCAWWMYTDEVRADPLFDLLSCLRTLVEPISADSKAVVKILVWAGNHGSVVLGQPAPDGMLPEEREEARREAEEDAQIAAEAAAAAAAVAPAPTDDVVVLGDESTGQ